MLTAIYSCPAVVRSQGLLCDQIKEELGISRVRGDTFGYLQRSFVGCVSDVDQREAREVGQKAVQHPIWGNADGSMAIGAYRQLLSGLQACPAGSHCRQDPHHAGRIHF